MKNGFGLINRIPPDVIALIPNSWGKLDKGLFFGGVPYLREIGPDGVPLVFGGQNGRLVSLTRLKNLTIHGTAADYPSQLTTF